MKTSEDAVLIDVGTGNIHSVLNALQSLGFTIKLTSNPQDVRNASRLVLPGVGAFGRFMEGMRQLNLEESILEALQKEIPMLGICVGMQALLDIGKEMGEFKGLGLVEGEVVRFPQHPQLKVPHNGWNQLHFEKASPIFNGLDEGSFVYFTHSYYCSVTHSDDWAASTDYGFRFASSVQKGLIFGVQFHPEKSQKNGLKILSNFFKV
jgi:imidazole glycerol-phosphate synthase subunit HisH